MGLRQFWQNNKVLLVMGPTLGLIHWGWFNLQSSAVLHQDRDAAAVAHMSEIMKPQSWLRRNWLLAAGGAFLTVHLVTWVMQRAMKSAVRSEVALKQKAHEKLD